MMKRLWLVFFMFVLVSGVVWAPCNEDDISNCDNPSWLNENIDSIKGNPAKLKSALQSGYCQDSCLKTAAESCTDGECLELAMAAGRAGNECQDTPGCYERIIDNAHVNKDQLSEISQNTNDPNVLIKVLGNSKTTADVATEVMKNDNCDDACQRSLEQKHITKDNIGLFNTQDNLKLNVLKWVVLEHIGGDQNILINLKPASLASDKLSGEGREKLLNAMTEDIAKEYVARVLDDPSFIAGEDYPKIFDQNLQRIIAKANPQIKFPGVDADNPSGIFDSDLADDLNNDGVVIWPDGSITAGNGGPIIKTDADGSGFSIDQSGDLFYFGNAVDFSGLENAENLVIIEDHILSAHSSLTFDLPEGVNRQGGTLRIGDNSITNFEPDTKIYFTNLPDSDDYYINRVHSHYFEQGSFQTYASDGGAGGYNSGVPLIITGKDEGGVIDLTNRIYSLSTVQGYGLQSATLGDYGTFLSATRGFPVFSYNLGEDTTFVNARKGGSFTPAHDRRPANFPFGDNDFSVTNGGVVFGPNSRNVISGYLLAEGRFDFGFFLGDREIVAHDPMDVYFDDLGSSNVDVDELDNPALFIYERTAGPFQGAPGYDLRVPYNIDGETNDDFINRLPGEGIVDIDNYRFVVRACGSECPDDPFRFIIFEDGLFGEDTISPDDLPRRFNLGFENQADDSEDPEGGGGNLQLDTSLDVGSLNIDQALIDSATPAINLAGNPAQFAVPERVSLDSIADSICGQRLEGCNQPQKAAMIDELKASVIENGGTVRDDDWYDQTWTNAGDIIDLSGILNEGEIVPPSFSAVNPTPTPTVVDWSIDKILIPDIPTVITRSGSVSYYDVLAQLPPANSRGIHTTQSDDQTFYYRNGGDNILEYSIDGTTWEDANYDDAFQASPQGAQTLGDTIGSPSDWALSLDIDFDISLPSVIPGVGDLTIASDAFSSNPQYSDLDDLVDSIAESNTIVLNPGILSNPDLIEGQLERNPSTVLVDVAGVIDNGEDRFTFQDSETGDYFVFDDKWELISWQDATGTTGWVRESPDLDELLLDYSALPSFDAPTSFVVGGDRLNYGPIMPTSVQDVKDTGWIQTNMHGHSYINLPNGQVLVLASESYADRDGNRRATTNTQSGTGFSREEIGSYATEDDWIQNVVLPCIQDPDLELCTG